MLQGGGEREPCLYTAHTCWTKPAIVTPSWNAAPDSSDLKTPTWSRCRCNGCILTQSSGLLNSPPKHGTPSRHCKNGVRQRCRV